MNNNEILTKVKSTILCLMAHPDNEPNSEFADRIDDLIDIRDELSERQVTTEAENNHETKQLNIADVSISVCPYCKSERTKKLRTLHACLDCQGTFLANES